MSKKVTNSKLLLAVTRCEACGNTLKEIVDSEVKAGEIIGICPKCGRDMRVEEHHFKRRV